MERMPNERLGQNGRRDQAGMRVGRGAADELVARGPDCEHALRRLWDYLDGELGRGEMTAIDQHLAHCAFCRASVIFARRLLEGVRSIRVPLGGHARLRWKILRRLRHTRR